MSAENTLEPLGIDIEAWRLEVENFAEQTQHALNSIGDNVADRRHRDGTGRTA